MRADQRIESFVGDDRAEIADDLRRGRDTVSRPQLRRARIRLHRLRHSGACVALPTMLILPASMPRSTSHCRSPSDSVMTWSTVRAGSELAQLAVAVVIGPAYPGSAKARVRCHSPLTS